MTRRARRIDGTGADSRRTSASCAGRAADSTARRDEAAARMAAAALPPVGPGVPAGAATTSHRARRPRATARTAATKESLKSTPTPTLEGPNSKTDHFRCADIVIGLEAIVNRSLRKARVSGASESYCR